MSEANVLRWFLEQFTFGNFVTMASLAFAFGVQYRRLQDIERDVQAIKAQQNADSIATAATYARRDVLAETLQSINQRLGNIEHDLREVKARHVP